MKQKAWVISVSMGYGHQRTAYPLRDLALAGRVIPANNYRGIPERDKRIWETSRRFYESISRFKRIPLVGQAAFLIYDKLQKIPIFYPKRDLSKPNVQVRQIFSLIKKGWGKHLIEKLKKKSLPLITTFFTPAFMAEVFNYPKDIFCVVCDADISRTWVPLAPAESKIKYFAPTERVVERLKLYGVKPKNIFFTGYPLPKENIGTGQPAVGLETLEQDLAHRILNLDPKKKYQKQYEVLVKRYLDKLPEKSNHPLTIMFAVGGAGAQREIGAKILKSLAPKIKKEQIKIILVAGIREKVKEYFLENIKRLGLKENKNIDPHHKNFGVGVKIIFEKDMESYFQKFNRVFKSHTFCLLQGIFGH